MPCLNILAYWITDRGSLQLSWNSSDIYLHQRSLEHDLFVYDKLVTADGRNLWLSDYVAHFVAVSGDPVVRGIRLEGGLFFIHHFLKLGICLPHNISEVFTSDYSRGISQGGILDPGKRDPGRGLIPSRVPSSKKVHLTHHVLRGSLDTSLGTISLEAHESPMIPTCVISWNRLSLCSLPSTAF